MNPTVLDRIMAYKREELPRRKREVPLADIRAQAMLRPRGRDFLAAIQRPGVQMIAEIKRASPSKGLLSHDFDPVALAETYVRSGAAAISVLTDARFFQGKIGDLGAVRSYLDGLRPPRSETPLLRKDFIFDDYQVYEARAAGADAILLIVAALSDSDLRRLIAASHSLGMSALVEVHDESEIDRALAAGARLVGINNRDLRDFTVSLETAVRLRPCIPEGIAVVSESGIHTASDVERLADLGIDAVLVGEAIITARDRAAKLKELVRAGRAGRNPRGEGA